jgi:methyl-accepting chemotaxis protein
MALPEEDRGPAWLRNWEYIEADIQAMDDFAKKLRAEVETNYATHLTPIYDDMGTKLPQPPQAFPELSDLMTTHQEATQTTTNFVHDYANRSAGMAQAASQISSNYHNADAFAQASVTSVHKALDTTGVANPSTGDPADPTGATPTGATPTGGTSVPPTGGN